MPLVCVPYTRYDIICTGTYYTIHAYASILYSYTTQRFYAILLLISQLD